MANQMTLMQFLQQDPPAISITEKWTDFNLATILNEHRDLLTDAAIQIDRDALVNTPPLLLGAEDGLREQVATYADRPVRRALSATFQFLAGSPGGMAGRTAMTLGAGSAALTVDDFVPDRAFYDPSVVVAPDPEDAQAAPPPPPPNRLPGEVKPSHKWDGAWLDRASAVAKAKSRLKQLSYYMVLQGMGHEHRGAKYGYMISDQALVAFRKVNAHGRIQYSEPIPWGGDGDGAPRLTVLLALWYLGMLASSDSGWTLPRTEGDPTDAQLRAGPPPPAAPGTTAASQRR